MVLSSEEGRDAVQLMLKVSESNNHAELEKMKLRRCLSSCFSREGTSSGE